MLYLPGSTGRLMCASRLKVGWFGVNGGSWRKFPLVSAARIETKSFGDVADLTRYAFLGATQCEPMRMLPGKGAVPSESSTEPRP